MNSSDYRREYAAFCSAFERERHRHHAGLAPTPRFEPILERFADLWTRQAIADLSQARSETPIEFETERAGLSALLCAARIGYVESAAREVKAELARCELTSRMAWGGESLTAHEGVERMASERDAARRRELFARWLDAVRPCDDLRAELLATRDAAARTLGLSDSLALYETTSDADAEKRTPDEAPAGAQKPDGEHPSTGDERFVEARMLADAAQVFLRLTAPAYQEHLARWAARELPLGVAGVPHYADSFYFARLSSLDAFFDARNLRASYEAVLRGLGLSLEKQKNIRLEEATRAEKKARTECFGVAPPDEVYLSVGAGESGARLFRSFFEHAGRAECYGWSSRQLASKHPEFIHAPDRATLEGYALLLRTLFADAVWVGEQKAFKASEAWEIARSCALVELYEARLCAARLRYQISLREASDVRAEQLAHEYAATHTEATGFRYDPATSLFDTIELQRAATSFRARLFAAGLAEYLRGRYGRRWWASPRAGDELVDMWNTSSRYAVEELARLVGVGAPDAEFLASSMASALNAG